MGVGWKVYNTNVVCKMEYWNAKVCSNANVCRMHIGMLKYVMCRRGGYMAKVRMTQHIHHSGELWQ